MILLPIAVAVLLLISALLASSETALFALVRMEHTRTNLSASVQHALDRLMARPLESLMVIIGVNEASNVFAECFATTFMIFWLGQMGAYLSVPLMLVTVLIFCDITPKTFALGFPGFVAEVTARPLATLAAVVHPIAKWVTPASPPPRPEPVSEAEFKALLRVSEFQGQVEPQERELIHKVFDFGTRRVSEVMTPREKIYALDIATPPDRIVRRGRRRPFLAHPDLSRQPRQHRRDSPCKGPRHAAAGTGAAASRALDSAGLLRAAGQAARRNCLTRCGAAASSLRWWSTSTASCSA